MQIVFDRVIEMISTNPWIWIVLFWILIPKKSKHHS